MRKISKQLSDRLEPCKHMEVLISRASDGTLRGPARWYTQLHLIHCKNCKDALEGLRELNAEVERLANEAGPDLKLANSDWEKIEEAWDAREKEVK